MAQKNGAVEQLVGNTPTGKLVEPKAPDYAALTRAEVELGRKEAGLKEQQERATAERLRKESQLIQQQSENQERMIADAEAYLAPQKPHLEPNKTTFKDFAGMFSVLSALTFAVGGRGRGAGMAGLAALNGAVEGYNKGQKDVFDRNMKEFEKQIQNYKSISEETYRKLKQSIEAGGLKTEAGRLAAKDAELMDQGVVAARLQAGDAKAAFDAAKMAVTQAEKLQLAYERAKDKQQKASQQVFMIQRSVNALGGVASALENIKSLPAGTTTEILPNLTTRDGAINFIRNYGARTLSSEEAQAMEVLFTGVTRNLAAIEAAGAATGLVGLATQMEKLIPRAGQSAVTTALQLADIKRIAIENIKPVVDSGLMPPQQQQVAADLIRRIEKAIPFTNEDIISAQFGGRETLGQQGAEIAKKQPKEGETSTSKSGKAIIFRNGQWEYK